MTLDPQKEFVEKNHTIVQQIFEGLVRFSPEGKIKPALAVSWHRLDPNSIQFKLRKRVRFHNGETFDAKSVKFSIERYLDPNTKFPALGFIQTLKEVEIVDSHTVNVITHYPDGLLLHRLAGFIVMVPPKYVQKNGETILHDMPIGTGAFRFKAWRRDREIELEANTNYWEEGLPKLDGLVFRFLKPENQVKQLLKGKVDIVTELPGTGTLKIQKSKGTKIIKGPTLFTVAASFNISSGPLQNLLVRQALNYAIDKNDLIRYDLLGNGRVVNSLVLSEHPGRIDSNSLNSYSYNPDKAKKLLKQAGYENNLRLRLIEVKATRTAKIIIAHWNRIGIKTELVSTTDPKIGEDIRKQPWDIFVGSCPDPMYHPFFIHSIFLHSQSPYSITKNDLLDRYIEQLIQEGSSKEQDAKIWQLAKYVNENALSLFTYQRIKTYGVNKNVQFEPYLSGMPYFRTVQFIREAEW